MEKKQILFICSLNKKDNPLRVIDEISVIEPLMLSSENRDKYFFAPKLSVSTDNLTRTILNSNAGSAPFVLHFSLHGNKEKGLKFIGRNDAPTFQSIAYFDEVLEELNMRDQTLKCLVFNVCHSDSLAQSASKFVDYVIGVDGTVDDLAAIEFSRGFYSQLLDSDADKENLFNDCFRFGQLYIKQWVRDEQIQIEDGGPPYHERFKLYSLK